MAATTGHQQRFGLGTQSGGVATREFFINSNGITNARTQIQNQGTYGSRDFRAESTVEGTYTAGGTVELNPRADDLAFLMEYILGGAASGNDFAVAEAIPEMTVEMYRTIETVKVTKAKINSATFASRMGQELSLSLDIQGCQWTPGITFASISGTLSTQAPFVHHQAVLTIGGTAYQVDDVNLTIGNNLILDRFYNSQYRVDLPEGNRTVELSCTFPWTSTESALYALATAGAAATLVYTSGNVSLTFTFGKLQAAVNGPPMGARGSEVKMPISFVSRRTGSTPSIAATVDSTP